MLIHWLIFQPKDRRDSKRSKSRGDERRASPGSDPSETEPRKRRHGRTKPLKSNDPKK